MKLQSGFASNAEDLYYSKTSGVHVELTQDVITAQRRVLQASNWQDGITWEYLTFKQYENLPTIKRASVITAKRSITFRVFNNAGVMEGINYILIVSPVSGTHGVSIMLQWDYTGIAATQYPSYASCTNQFGTVDISSMFSSDIWYTIDFVWQIAESDATHYRVLALIYVNNVLTANAYQTPVEILKTDFLEGCPGLYIGLNHQEDPEYVTAAIDVLVVD